MCQQKGCCPKETLCNTLATPGFWWFWAGCTARTAKIDKIPCKGGLIRPYHSQKAVLRKGYLKSSGSVKVDSPKNIQLPKGLLYSFWSKPTCFHRFWPLTFRLRETPTSIPRPGASRSAHRARSLQRFFFLGRWVELGVFFGVPKILLKNDS